MPGGLTSPGEMVTVPMPPGAGGSAARPDAGPPSVASSWAVGGPVCRGPDVPPIAIAVRAVDDRAGDANPRSTEGVRRAVSIRTRPAGRSIMGEANPGDADDRFYQETA